MYRNKGRLEFWSSTARETVTMIKAITAYKTTNSADNSIVTFRSYDPLYVLAEARSDDVRLSDENENKFPDKIDLTVALPVPAFIRDARLLGSGPLRRFTLMLNAGTIADVLIVVVFARALTDDDDEAMKLD